MTPCMYNVIILTKQASYKLLWKMRKRAINKQGLAKQRNNKHDYRTINYTHNTMA